MIICQCISNDNMPIYLQPATPLSTFINSLPANRNGLSIFPEEQVSMLRLYISSLSTKPLHIVDGRPTFRPIHFVQRLFVQRFSSNPNLTYQDWTKTPWAKRCLTKRRWMKTGLTIVDSAKGSTQLF